MDKSFALILLMHAQSLQMVRWVPDLPPDGSWGQLATRGHHWCIVTAHQMEPSGQVFGVTSKCYTTHQWCPLMASCPQEPSGGRSGTHLTTIAKFLQSPLHTCSRFLKTARTSRQRLLSCELSAAVATSSAVFTEKEAICSQVHMGSQRAVGNGVAVASMCRNSLKNSCMWFLLTRSACWLSANQMYSTWMNT